MAPLDGVKANEEQGEGVKGVGEERVGDGDGIMDTLTRVAITN